VPDPQDKETFLRSKLDWDQPEREPYRALLDWYRTLLALRASHPELTDPRLHQVRVDFDEDARWLLIQRGRLRIAANLGDAEARLPLRPPASAADAGPDTTAEDGPAGPVTLASSDPGLTVTRDTLVLPPAAFAVIDLGTA
jgi:maltooligosyltrehalose trehalohydrolase